MVLWGTSDHRQRFPLFSLLGLGLVPASLFHDICLPMPILDSENGISRNAPSPSSLHSPHSSWAALGPARSWDLPCQQGKTRAILCTYDVSVPNLPAPAPAIVPGTQTLSMVRRWKHANKGLKSCVCAPTICVCPILRWQVPLKACLQGTHSPGFSLTKRLRSYQRKGSTRDR